MTQRSPKPVPEAIAPCQHGFDRRHFVPNPIFGSCGEGSWCPGPPPIAAPTTPLEAWRITPTCRLRRGDDGAWDEAVARLRQVYRAQVQRFGPAATLTVSITRTPAPGIPERVYRACFGEVVHNHGAEEGRGLACRERVVDGGLRGECISGQ